MIRKCRELPLHFFIHWGRLYGAWIDCAAAFGYNGYREKKTER